MGNTSIERLRMCFARDNKSEECLKSLKDRAFNEEELNNKLKEIEKSGGLQKVCEKDLNLIMAELESITDFYTITAALAAKRGRDDEKEEYVALAENYGKKLREFRKYKNSFDF